MYEFVLNDYNLHVDRYSQIIWNSFFTINGCRKIIVLAFSYNMVSISPTFYEHLYLYESVFQSYSLLTVWLCSFLLKEYWRISCLLNVGEIDYWCQFHQQFTRAFFIRKCFFCQNVTREKHFRTNKLLVKCW